MKKNFQGGLLGEGIGIVDFQSNYFNRLYKYNKKCW